MTDKPSTSRTSTSSTAAATSADPAAPDHWLYPRNEDGSPAGIPNPHQRYWRARHG